MDPVELLHSFLEDHRLPANDLAELLDVSESHVSKILNYQKAMSPDVIRKLAMRFKVSPRAFTRQYELRRRT